MESRAQLRYYRSSPQKVRLVAGLVRGKPIECALRSSAVLGFFGFPTLGYHLAAQGSGLGSYIDDPVRGPHHFFVVFDYDNGIAQVP